MKLTFPFEPETSGLFGHVYRPVIQCDFWSLRLQKWITIDTLIDTGADYSLLPHFLAYNLGIDLKKDCKRIQTMGVGGGETVYFYPKCKIHLGRRSFFIPLGFLSHDDIPALLGRQECLDRFKILLDKRKTTLWI